MPKLLMASLLAALLVVSMGPARSASAADAAPYNINVILSLTGQGAFVGQAQHDTLQILERLENKKGGIKGHPIHFVFQDDQTNPQVAVQQMNAIVNEKAAVVLGPSIAVTCRAVQPIVVSGPADYCLSPSVTPVKAGYVFSTIVATQAQLDGLFHSFRQRGWTRIAVLNPTDATGQDADLGIAAAIAKPENKDLSIVATEHFTVTDLSVSAQIQKIKAANPSVVLSWATGTPFATVLHAINDAGLENVPLIGSPGNMTYAQMKQYGNILPKELYFPSQPYTVSPAQPQLAVPQKEFDDTFKAINVRPDLQTGIAWDAAKLFIMALRKIGPTATATQVRDYLQTVKGYAGISGMYDFTDGSNRGLGAKDGMLVRWVADKDTWIPASKMGFGVLR